MAATAAVHPSDQTLQSYGLGKLDDLLAEAVGKHLKECDSCCRRVAEVTSDSFVGRLRDAQARPESVLPVGSSLAGPSKLGGESRTPSPPPASTLPPGLAEHPDYQVLRELGRGGMGVVYLAENRMMGRKEVLKVVNSQLLNRKGVLERFLREIRSAAQLHHPNIVTAYSATRVGESIVFSMQFVDGYDLSERVEKSGPLSVAHACNFVYQAALGLQHAHEHGMVHRDIKPSNLMLARDGNKPVVKVLDFGLAKVTSEGVVHGGLTQEGQMLGTPHYIAPEQTVSAQKADIRADIYSLGCTLYCLLTGHPPFDAPSLYELLQAHHSMDAKPLNFIRPEVPVELAAVVAKMLAKEPERRFQTPVEVAEALKPFFRKDGVNSKALKPEVSQVGPVDPKQEPVKVPTPTTQPQPKADANPAPGQTAAGSRAEPMWESLIKINETDDTEDVIAVVSKPKRQWPRWFWPAIAGAFSFAMIALGITIYVATDYGRIKIIVEGPKADVQVDGEQVLIKTPRESITLHAGEHELIVKWRDGQFRTDRFVVRRGQDEELRVEYEPRETDRSGTNRQTSPSTETASRDTAEVSADIPTAPPSAPKAETVESRSTSDNTNTWSKLAVSDARSGYVPLFDGKDVADWSAWDDSGPLDAAAAARIWSVRDGVLHGSGRLSHLFSPRGYYRDFRVCAEVMIHDGGNSGLIFRASKTIGVPPGYEAQINSTHRDPRKTGSLYLPPQPPIVWESSPVPPDTWFKLEAEAMGNRIRVWINDEPYVDWTDRQATYTKGYFAIQVHDPQTHVQIRKLEVMEINSVASGGRDGQSAEASEVSTQPRAAKAVTASTATKSNPRKGVNKSVEDALQPGTVWTGERTYRQGWWSPGTVTYELHVTEREGRMFKGHKFDNGQGRNRVEVEGVVDGRNISWTERSGNFVLTMRGNLKGETIRVQFNGDRGGVTVLAGDGKLTRQ